MTWGGLEEAVCREYGIFLKWGMWKRWLFSCQEKIFGHGPGVPFQCSAVRECHAFEFSGVVLLPAWLRSVFFRFFLPRPFRFFAKNREKHRRLLKIGLQS
jgi:hypothetical protein